MPPPRPGYEVLASGPALEGEGWRLSVRIPEGSPLFAGHFPGHPILPGVAHLALVTRALADWRQGRRVKLAGVRGWKLRQPVQPGETLEIRLEPKGEGEVGFVLERAGETVSRGTVEVAWR